MFTAYLRKNGEHLRNTPLLPDLSQMAPLGLEYKPLRHWGKEGPSAWDPLTPPVPAVIFLSTWLLLPLLTTMALVTDHLGLTSLTSSPA